MLLLMLRRGLAISSSEEQLALSLLGGPAFTLALNNQELMKPDEMNFELLGPGVHTAGERVGLQRGTAGDSVAGVEHCPAEHARVAKLRTREACGAQAPACSACILTSSDACYVL
eukprot:GHRQ01030421.1.p1 GENE.GHRQ01030421.1~~GHRQ01030421.1.p1  ORF type:complete len:115 (+),score=32.29 GHRQ01030421.1:204-548(+)